MGHYSSFVVRIWIDDDHRVVRGHVQHVGTQEDAHFLDFDKMKAFMMGHLEPPPEPGDEPEEMECGLHLPEEAGADG